MDFSLKLEKITNTSRRYNEEVRSNMRLLILSCSQRKRDTPDVLPAWQRYDGPAYRVMNKFLRLHPSEVQSLDVYILSAEFGLIPSDKPIPDYDRRITAERVKELQYPTLSKLKQILVSKQYEELFINLGEDYRRVLIGYESVLPVNLKVIVSTGSIGYKLGQLRYWLYGETLKSPDDQAEVVHRNKVSLRGVEIVLTPKQVIQLARSALAKEQNLPRCQMWYVRVGDQQVPPKWLVSLLTGLPVSVFHTSEARRILQQIGIQVYSRL